jgi:hypothetical protein
MSGYYTPRAGVKRLAEQGITLAAPTATGWYGQDRWLRNHLFTAGEHVAACGRVTWPNWGADAEDEWPRCWHCKRTNAARELSA